MFMEIAVGAIGIGVVLMVGYLIVAQVRTSLPTTANNLAFWNGTGWNTTDSGVTTSLDSTQTTVFAGFALVAVGIIVLAAFGLVNVFR